MGLDQWAYVKLINFDPTELDNTILDQELIINLDIAAHVRICTWRKHPNLQGWMERLWRKRTKLTDDFNCVEVSLTSEDIDELKLDVENSTLNGGYSDTTGFFFGDNSDEEYKEQDLEFCKQAFYLLDKGLKICYNSWW
jgi:hypothetical protein